ncbi:MAG: DHH family phosphoesterase [Lachnospiraceae bacterium]|nr:DHH family phosphoesterase [Lachnospiraceae bacterium]
MRRIIKLKGAMRLYLSWPIFLTFLLICMNLSILTVSKKAAAVMAIFVLIYAVVTVLLYFVKKPLIINELVHFAAGYSQVQRKLLKELAIPYVVMDTEGTILWANDEFMDLAQFAPRQKNIKALIPEITSNNLPTVEKDVTLHVEVNERKFEVCLRTVNTPDFDEDILWQDMQRRANELIALYMYDETEIVALRQENEDKKLVVGLLYLDNYEETFESIDEVRRSLLTALVDRKINKYMTSVDAIIKKLEKDKYIFVFQQKYLEQIRANKFSLVEEVRGTNVGNDGLSVTISIGLGVDADTYSEGYKFAQMAIDKALGNGGDQTAIKYKSETNIETFGATKESNDSRNSKTKARVKADDLKRLMESKERVVVMGHVKGDSDSFGAAIGIYRIAKMLNKEVHIVINEVTGSIRPMLTKFLESPEYEDDMFIDSAKAQKLVDDGTLLVVVDVNIPGRTECEAILSMTKAIAVIDHHRAGSGNEIMNPELRYVETYPSSACEMVAECLQFIANGAKVLKPLEADAMYAGIMIDTNNFVVKTGVRTAEATAYLHRTGASVARVRKMLRTDMQEYCAKAKSIAEAEIFENRFAFAVVESAGLTSPTEVAAQTANDLMDINGVMASFVFTQSGGRVFISARSIDELNVQVVTNRLGGGGHFSVAGAQYDDCDIPEAIERVKEVLRQMIEEGEIKF